MNQSERKEMVLALYGQLVEAQVQISSLEREQRQVKEKLALLIEENGVCAGIKRVTVRQSRVSWKEVAEKSREALIPKTKWGEWQKIAEEHTKVSVYDRFTELKEA